jgi:hypothetical protein
MSSRAVLHVEGMYFSDCKIKQTKNKRRYLVIGYLNE